MLVEYWIHQEPNHTSKTENIGYKIHINIDNKQEPNHDLDEKIQTLADQINIKGNNKIYSSNI